MAKSVQGGSYDSSSGVFGTNMADWESIGELSPFTSMDAVGSQTIESVWSKRCFVAEQYFYYSNSRMIIEKPTNNIHHDVMKTTGQFVYIIINGSFLQLLCKWVSLSLGLLPSKVFRVRFWMRHYGSPSMKPTQTITNKAAFAALDLGPVKRSVKKRSKTTTRRYKDASGKTRFVGKKALKKSQNLSIMICVFVWSVLNNPPRKDVSQQLAKYRPENLGVWHVFPKWFPKVWQQSFELQSKWSSIFFVIVMGNPVESQGVHSPICS